VRFCLAWPRWAIGAFSLPESMQVAKLVMSRATDDSPRPNSATIAAASRRSMPVSAAWSMQSIASQKRR
jgi:hypothetical protein